MIFAGCSAVAAVGTRCHSQVAICVATPTNKDNDIISNTFTGGDCCTITKTTWPSQEECGCGRNGWSFGQSFPTYPITHFITLHDNQNVYCELPQVAFFRPVNLNFPLHLAVASRSWLVAVTTEPAHSGVRCQERFQHHIYENSHWQGTCI